MRTTIYIGLISILFFVTRPIFGYNLGDQTILKRFQTACYKINQHPSLWQGTHHRQGWDLKLIQYELLVEYPSYKERPQLTLYQGPTRYKIVTARSQQGRELALEAIEGGPPGQPPDKEPEGIDPLKNFSPYPLGTFDFGSYLAFSSEYAPQFFRGFKDNQFSGTLRIIEGRPIWIFDAKNLPWSLELLRHSFFPYRVLWKDDSEKTAQWRFKPEVDYQPWGIVSAQLQEISFAETVKQPTQNTEDIQTTWTLIQRFETPEDLKAWKAKNHDRPDKYYPPWNEEDRLYILKAY